MDSFVSLRKLTMSNEKIMQRLDIVEKLAIRNSKDVDLIISTIEKMLNTPETPKRKIGFGRTST